MIAQTNMKIPRKNVQFKYEMAKRKEKWTSLNQPMEQRLMIPLEAQSSVVKSLVSRHCYNDLSKMLDLPTVKFSDESSMSSVDTKIPYAPPDEGSLKPGPSRKITKAVQEIKLPSMSTISESLSSEVDYESLSIPEVKEQIVDSDILTAKTETVPPSEQFENNSDVVEVEKKIPLNHELMMKHKAILRFLGKSEVEAASWRVKETKDVSELSEMTLEEQGDLLMNKIAVDFCEWLRELGGNEKSFISEEILKELFQIGMDNPASRAICIKMQEKRVLYFKLAEFLGVPKKSFHEVLSQHLNWDASFEKKPTRLTAFGKGLPKDIRFKIPTNKTSEIWLEWNKLSPDQLSFADVYSTVTNLRSTKEYCKWLLTHPEHKKPQFLVDKGMFERAAAGTHNKSSRQSQTWRSTSVSMETSAGRVSKDPSPS